MSKISLAHSPQLEASMGEGRGRGYASQVVNVADTQTDREK